LICYNHNGAVFIAFSYVALETSLTNMKERKNVSSSHVAHGFMGVYVHTRLEHCSTDDVIKVKDIVQYAVLFMYILKENGGGKNRKAFGSDLLFCLSDYLLYLMPLCR
jgi:hypothetical protein